MAPPQRNERAGLVFSGIFVGCFWIISMLWLAQNGPTRSSSTTRRVSYASMVSEFEGELTYGLWHGEQRFGQLVYQSKQVNGNRHIEWQLSANPMGTGMPQSLTVNGTISFGPTNSLQDFLVQLSLGDLEFEIKGRRKEAIIVVEYHGMGISSTRVLPVDSCLVVGDGLMPGFPGICPKNNKSLTWSMLDPLSLQPLEVVLRRVQSPPLPPPEHGCVLSLEYRGTESLLWVDESGIVVRQRTPLGWDLILETEKSIDEKHMAEDRIISHEQPRELSSLSCPIEGIGP